MQGMISRRNSYAWAFAVTMTIVSWRNDWRDKVGVLSLHSADSFRIPCDTFSTNIESRMCLHFWFSDFLEKYIFRHGFQLFLFSILLVARLKPWHEARLPETCGCDQDTPFCSRGLDRLKPFKNQRNVIFWTWVTFQVPQRPPKFISDDHEFSRYRGTLYKHVEINTASISQADLQISSAELYQLGTAICSNLLS